MATYIPGITDYIPQYQPFQPDYNFLGNMLQNAQSKYDANYKQLSKTYGTLLNSPMLREDNIQQRDEFFKMIDNDIKRISGMDLSLQQNVDAANAVFDSFYQNKEMVKDMVFTKEYQRQLEIGDNYRNCIDQDKCGGKYWDVGAQALHYRADEFKKANRQDTLTMSPGRFVPQINIQEKAMAYAKDLLGKDGTFGITSVNWSPDGRYIVTTKNGAQLQIPLQQLLLNQYGKDQSIIDMFNTQAYVQRKGFIQANAAQYGSEDAAEDAYFSQIDGQIQAVQQAYKEAQDLMNGTQARKTKLEEQIKTKGSTGGDDLSFDYVAAGTDAAAAQENVGFHEENVKIANSIFEVGDNRQMKRQRVDSLLARSMMGKDIGDSATIIAAMTGETSVKEDPYAKSYYDFSLDMRKMEQQHIYNKDEEFYKTMLDLSKQQALMEYESRGSATGPGNAGKFVEGMTGTTSTASDDVNADDRTEISEQYNTSEALASNYVSGLANVYLGVVGDENASMEDKIIARDGLKQIYGHAMYDNTGKVTRPGYDYKKNVFVLPNGTTTADAQEASKVFTERFGYRKLYERGQNVAKMNRSIDWSSDYTNSEETQQLLQNYSTNEQLYKTSSALWRENNKNVRNSTFAKNEFDTKMKNKPEAWDLYFTNDNRIKTKEQYIKDYVEANKSELGDHPGMYSGISPTTNAPVYSSGYTVTMDELKEDAAEFYETADEIYKKVYNGGHSANGVPLVKNMHSIADFGYKAGGTSAGGGVQFEWNTRNGASLGSQGLLSFNNDINAGTYFTIGNVGTVTEAQLSNSANAKAAYQQLIMDFKSGKLSKKEQAEAGFVTYMDLALSDKNKAGILVNFPQSWLDRYKGNKDDESWAKDPGLATQGVGVYIDKKGATNSFTQAYQTNPYDMILNHSDQTLTTPYGGTVKINKRNPNGSFTVTGSMKTYRVENGKVVEGAPVSVSNIYPAGTSGHNLYTGLNTWLNQANVVNQQFKQSQSQNMIFDPSQLPQIQTMLNTQAGDAPPQMNLSQMFLQNVQFNSQMMQP